MDCVLYLEGERFYAYRLLRAEKNRFGSTNEIGVFEMEADGLRQVPNPSAAFLSERQAASAGSAVTVPLEGTRALLVEVQALVAPTGLAMPRRTSLGVDLNRLHLLLAVLGKRVGLPLGSQDVYVNVVAGLKIAEPAADLGVALALASSWRDAPLGRGPGGGGGGGAAGGAAPGAPDGAPPGGGRAAGVRALHRAQRRPARRTGGERGAGKRRAGRGVTGARCAGRGC